MGIVEQLGNAQERKLASQQFADSGLRYIKDFFQLPRLEPLFLDELEDVLMEIGLQLQLQTVLTSYIELIENASRGAVGDQLITSLSYAALR